MHEQEQKPEPGTTNATRVEDPLEALIRSLGEPDQEATSQAWDQAVEELQRIDPQSILEGRRCQGMGE